MKTVRFRGSSRARSCSSRLYWHWRWALGLWRLAPGYDESFTHEVSASSESTLETHRSVVGRLRDVVVRTVGGVGIGGDKMKVVCSHCAQHGVEVGNDIIAHDEERR